MDVGGQRMSIEQLVGCHNFGMCRVRGGICHGLKYSSVPRFGTVFEASHKS